MHNPFRKLGLFAISFLVVSLLAALPALAQNRIIRGKITNDKGEPVVGASVSIQGIDVKREYNTKTDKKGEYFYMGIPAGEYRVVVRAQGYQPNFVQGIRPNISKESEVDLTLTPGQDQKLAFELTPEERAKLEKEMEKAAKLKELSGAVKAAFDAGLKLAQEGKHAEAIAEYKKALELDPDQPYVQANLADSYGKTDQNELALAAYQKAIALKPDDPAIYTNMGVLLGKMGKTAESQEAFKKAASMSPGSAAQNFYNLGATLVNSGKTAEAAEAFKQAIAADANFAEAYYQLGICLSGNPATMADAVKALKKYIEIGQKPDQVEVAKQLIAALGQK